MSDELDHIIFLQEEKSYQAKNSDQCEDDSAGTQIGYIQIRGFIGIAFPAFGPVKHLLRIPDKNICYDKKQYSAKK